MIPQPRWVLLGLFAFFHLGMAALWSFQPVARQSSPALTTLRDLGSHLDPSQPMLAWGVAYGLAGACLLVALAGIRPGWGWAGLELGGAVSGFYAGCLLVSTWRTPSQSFTGALVYGTIAMLHGVAALNQRR